MLLADVRELAAEIETSPELGLAGVMGVAPLGEDPDSAFERLKTAASRVSDVNPSAKIVSAGMSGDFAAAIGAGATHVRIGAAVLGDRPSVK